MAKKRPIQPRAGGMPDLGALFERVPPVWEPAWDIASAVPGAVYGAVTALPGLLQRATTGNYAMSDVEPPGPGGTSPQAVRDAFDLAGYAGVGSLAGSAPRGALRSGLGGEDMSDIIAAIKKIINEEAGKVPKDVVDTSMLPKLKPVRETFPGEMPTELAPVNPNLDPSVPARARRAVEMGFEDMPHFRGMRRAYDPEYAKNEPQWFSTNPEVATSYTGYSIDDAMKLKQETAAPQTMPTYLRPGNMIEVEAGNRGWSNLPGSIIPEQYRQYFPSWEPSAKYTTDEIVTGLSAANPDIIRFKNIMDHAVGKAIPSDVSVVLNPANIRSISAMFDPAKKGSIDPLAANPITSLLPGAPMKWQQPEEEQPMRMIPWT